MKLHLPKPLLLAVLACFVAPASWADTTITDNTTWGADITATTEAVTVSSADVTLTVKAQTLDLTNGGITVTDGGLLDLHFDNGNDLSKKATISGGPIVLNASNMNIFAAVHTIADLSIIGESTMSTRWGYGATISKLTGDADAVLNISTTNSEHRAPSFVLEGDGAYAGTIRLLTPTTGTNAPVLTINSAGAVDQAKVELSSGTKMTLTDSVMANLGSVQLASGSLLSISDNVSAVDRLKNVSGAGNVEISFTTNGNGTGLNLSGITGNIAVKSGLLTVKDSTLNENATIDLKSADSQLVFNGSGTELKNNVILSSSTTMHAKSGCSGTISGNIRGNSYDLTKAGSGTLTFSGEVHLNKLTVDAGSSIFENNLTISKAISNNGTITLNDKLTLNSHDVFENLYQESTPYGYGLTTTSGVAQDNTNGYAYGHQFVVINGNVILGDDFTFEGADSMQVIDGVGLVASKNDFVYTLFYVNTGTVNMGADGYTDMTAATYWVKQGATLNLNGKDFAGKTIKMDGGATITNTGTSYGDNARQMDAIVLNGDAEVNLDNNHGLIASGWDPSTLTLNGNTLTKKGDAIFYLINTTVDAGTIRIEDGAVQVGINHQAGKVTSAANTVFDMAGGTLYLDNGRLNAAGLTGTSGAVTQSYGNESNTNSTLQIGSNNTTAYEYGGTLAVTNLIKTGSGTQKITGDAQVTNLTMQGGELEFSNLTKDISITNTTALSTVKIGGMSVADGADVSVSGTTNKQLTLYVTGADVISIDRNGGALYTELVLNNNTNKSTWTGTLKLSNISGDTSVLSS